jgi:UDP-N-acetylmuramoyl-L-alanyl-D-glutamate--2,6-diaminopimelate ligase
VSFSARLAQLLETQNLARPLDPAIGGLVVGAITADSRAVRPGSLFFALPGTKVDGLAFARRAAEAGAVAVVAERRPADDPGIPVLELREGRGGTRRALAIAAARLMPRQPATVVAVTGTSGKTSTTVFARQLWTAVGRTAASFGTIGVVTADGVTDGSLTTPDPVALHRTLEALSQRGIGHLAMEASSHGLHQHRLDGVHLAATAFLNLSRDHLDYHPTMQDYFEAKMALFTRLGLAGTPAVIAAKAPWRQPAIDTAVRAGLKPVTVGARGSDIAVTKAVRDAGGQDLTLRVFGARHDVRLPLIGDFQASNALVAAALLIATGEPSDAVIGALARLQGVPGRLEQVGEVMGAPVLVDYAHKPEALETVLTILRPYTKGRLICVFGCGGDRDAGKRPIMGAISARLADVTIVTDDNPRSEAPAAIRRAILAAAPGAREIGDRAMAIEEAVGMLSPGDLLVIAGKGHEDGQKIGDVVLPFSDHAVARAAIRARGGTTTGVM